MQTSTMNQSFSSGGPEWVLLTEFSFSDFLSDQGRGEQPAAGFLLQSLRDLGISPECTESIARRLAGFAKEALARTKQGRLEVPGRIRIFFQKKMIDDAKSSKTSRPYHTEQGKKEKQMFPDSEANTIGGWGYFMIERGQDFPPDTSVIPNSYIDLYLYKEGEV